MIYAAFDIGRFMPTPQLCRRRRDDRLRRFVDRLEQSGQSGQSTITVTNALTWSQKTQARPGSSVRSKRMTAVRGFARCLSGIDPSTEVPPQGLVTSRQRWRPPFIYTAAAIAMLARDSSGDAVTIAQRDVFDVVRAVGRHRDTCR
ncbi:hypothetical protein MU0053_005096 [[Mycobacterium] burgundiense]|uniref:Uncharacterized protein n=1 Tax=[Mycobacterium] burgundiense TaxID=3064286 RepID=A0ABM9M7J0_9MYCO|nr:hypothetical protein [Mycolicibacterium sp. MU0053]CAJ1511179.1 hypothetical protein MU0053_005096 [Mycolicibacterium sp. MU0053]